MNKTAIKNFAIWARRKLISDITYKAGMLGVTENGIAQPLPQSTRDLQFFDIGTKDYAEVSGVAIAQRNALVKAIRAKEQGSDYKTAFRNVVEEVAYTWFNRLIAVRFMEVNDYLPSHIRVLSSENAGKLEPDFVTTPFDTDLSFSPYDQDRIYQLKDENKLDDLFRMLFIKQCNALSEILPALFEPLADYTELLLNISFTDKDGIVYHLTHDISEDEFNVEKEGQVEIIGWMYQYYNTEPKDEVFALLKKNVKITKERIPAATQLFTPDWIVRYMVENSLGRLWVEEHPNESLKENWKYYLEEAEQEPDVVEQLKKIRDEYAKLSPTDIKVIDPCMGSGHILVYAFDVLIQIYKNQGYVEREAAKSILVNNLYGIDIDTRAYQLAYFAVMMKARQYNRKIFQERITPNLLAIRNPRNISVSVLKKLGGLEPVGLRLVEEFEDAEEYGSILQPNITLEELDRLDKRLEEIRGEAEYGNLLERTEAIECLKLLKPLVKQARLLVQKYDVVVTNPPYMGKGLSNVLSSYLKKNYDDSKGDLFSVFIERCRDLTGNDRLWSMITQHSWMFLSSFEQLRKKMLEYTLINMCHLGTRAFEEIGGAVVQTTTFVYRKHSLKAYNSTFMRLVDYQSQSDKEKAILESCKQDLYTTRVNDLAGIVGAPLSYWVSDQVLKALQNTNLECLTISDGQNKTGDNDTYLREFWEVNADKIGINKKWLFYAKGGSYRKWTGNLYEIINWSDEARKHYHVDPACRIVKEYLWYRKGITWGIIAQIGFRVLPEYATFDMQGSSVYISDMRYYYSIIAFLNTKVAYELLQVFNTTLSFQIRDIRNLPFMKDEIRMHLSDINRYAEDNINISQQDWDSFETSWDFKHHPLVFDLKLKEEYKDSQWASDRLSKCSSLSWLYEGWATVCEQRFQLLKENEEELNRIFIGIYGLQDELTPDVEDKDVTVRKADLGREIRSLISYAIGCMFGRYSMYKEGLVFAGGKMEDHFSYYGGTWNDAGNMTWDQLGKHTWGEAGKSFYYIPEDGKTPLECWKVDADNCIPITDEEYFQDDIVGYFVEFVREAYGADYLEENLDFIAKALGNKGNTSRDVIRNYFLNDFYKDHLKIYQKRPIYWLFDSGKQNGFKALVYMHRWNADTVGNLRIEYLHKMQTVYEHEIENCQEMIDHGSGHDVAVATRRKEKLVKQLKECKDYDALVAHIAFSKIDIDLDDGVKANYRKVQTGADGKFCEILANSKDIMTKEK